MENEKELKHHIATIIRAHGDVFGVTTAYAIARRVPTLTIAENGEILEVSGNLKAIIKKLKSEYIAFSGEASKAIIHTIEQKHPPLV